MSDGYRFIGGILCDEDGEPYQHPKPRAISTPSDYAEFNDDGTACALINDTCDVKYLRRLAEWFAKAADHIERRDESLKDTTGGEK